MIELIFGETEFPKYILKKIKKKHKYLIIDLTKKKIFKKDKNSYNVSIGQFGKIISILRSLDLKNDEKDELSFDIEVELMKGNSKEINKKLQFIKRKISDLEDESNQFQNNLEFFSNSSTDNPLFKNVSSKIDSINSRINFWKKRITKIEKIN